MAIRVSNVTVQALIDPNTISRNRAVSQDLGLQQDTFFLNAIGDRQVPSNTLNFQGIVNSPNFPSVQSTLEFQQTALPGLLDGNASTFMSLIATAEYCFGTKWTGYEVSDFIDFSWQAGTGVTGTASSTLAFVDSAFPNNAITQTLSFQQFALAGLGHMAFNVMSLSGDIETQSDFLRLATQDTLVEQAFTYYIDNSCNRKLYKQFEGTGLNQEPFPDQRLEFDSDFVLETLTGPKSQLVLRSPEPDDRDRLSFNRVNRETRGGELGVFSDPNWAKVETLLFTIVALKPTKINQLQVFLQTTLGQEILLQDWTGTVWQGVITTPNESAVEDANGWWTISFEFEGEPYEGQYEDQALTLGDVITVQVDYTRSVTHDLGLVQDVIGGGSLNVPEEIGDLEIDGEVSGFLSVDQIFDDFSGAASSIDGVAADLGGTWSAESSFLANGAMTAVNSGAYLPFSPEDDKIYSCIWKVRSLTENVGQGQESRFFLSEEQPTNIIPGVMYDGTTGPSCLKAGFALRSLNGTDENHLCRLGGATDGEADAAVFSDPTLASTATNIDLRLILDTRPAIWTATWYAKIPASSDWTQVRAETNLLHQVIGGIGYASDNVDETFVMLELNVSEEVPF